jgi:hypothetical protein
MRAHEDRSLRPNNFRPAYASFSTIEFSVGTGVGTPRYLRGNVITIDSEVEPRVFCVTRRIILMIFGAISIR